MSAKHLLIASLAGFALVASGGAADAAKKGNGVVVKDSKDKGSLYPADIYKRCDIRQLKATVRGKNLIVTVKFTGKAETAFNTELRLNTAGSRVSDPEYVLSEVGTLFTAAKGTYTPDAAKTSLKKGKTAQQWALPLKKIGKPKKVGLQAKTCGEGAVDIAPGSNYFDDTGWDGTIRNKYAYLRTRG